MRRVRAWAAEAGVLRLSPLHLSVTDGARVAAIRSVSVETIEPAPLAASESRRDKGRQEAGTRARAPAGGHAVILASERVTDHAADRVPVAPNHAVLVEADLGVTNGLVTTSGAVAT
jgi:hypothetical protein